MNKAILGVIVAVIVVAGGIFLFMRGENGTEDNENGQTALNNGSDNGSLSTPKTLREAMEEYEEQQCTYSDEFGSGIIYVGNGAMRGDFTTVSSSGEIDSHMIVDNDAVYVWQDGEAQGFTMALSAMQEVEGDQSVDIDKEQDFECNDWNVDRDKFDLPPGVTFTDYSDLMMQTQNQNQITVPAPGQNPQEDLLQQQCSVCATLPDAASQEQCRVTLSCP